jgi:NAD(P)-dependent dehydrogenase (short-subunit alcohol dehydrogenase family)
LHGIEKIFILARSRTKFDAALEEWRERDGINLGLTSDNKDPVKLHFISCDLGDICAVREAADQIKQDTDRLDLVICNAGRWAQFVYKSTCRACIHIYVFCNFLFGEGMRSVVVFVENNKSQPHNDVHESFIIDHSFLL